MSFHTIKKINFVFDEKDDELCRNVSSLAANISRYLKSCESLIIVIRKNYPLKDYRQLLISRA